jgi:dTDP-4-dehydrorhamnose 3,5-epimerase-like enzyme
MDVFLDLRSESDTYGEFESIKLKEDDSLALLIPEGFAHGYSTLSNEAILIYLQSGNYNYKYDESINPLSLGIDWQVDNPIISEKDKASENFKRFKSKF